MAQDRARRKAGVTLHMQDIGGETANVFPIEGKCPQCGEENLRLSKFQEIINGESGCDNWIRLDEKVICWCCGLTLITKKVERID